MAHFLTVDPCSHGLPCIASSAICDGHEDTYKVECTEPETSACRWNCSTGCESWVVDFDTSPPTCSMCERPMTLVECNAKEWLEAITLDDFRDHLSTDGPRPGRHQVDIEWDDSYIATYADEAR